MDHLSLNSLVLYFSLKTRYHALCSPIERFGRTREEQNIIAEDEEQILLIPNDPRIKGLDQEN